MFITNPTNRFEGVTSVKRRGRGAAFEKVRRVEETFEPRMSPNQLFGMTRTYLKITDRARSAINVG